MDQRDLPLLVERVERCPKTQDDYTRLNGTDSPTLKTISCSVLICGDAVQALTLLPDKSIQTVVTSPPYWSLRDYNVQDQIGRDDTLDTYVASVVDAFEGMKRVLRDDGTVWLNVGDSYTSGNRRYRAPDKKNRARAMSVRPPTPKGLKPKDLIGVPWRLAFALQAAGWWIRSEAIWYKPNAHPESVRDRPTKAHETVFLLSRNRITTTTPRAYSAPETSAPHRVGNPDRAGEAAEWGH